MEDSVGRASWMFCSYYHWFFSCMIYTKLCMSDATYNGMFSFCWTLNIFCGSLSFLKVVVGCYEGKIYFLDFVSGVISWTFQTSGEVLSLLMRLSVAMFHFPCKTCSHLFPFLVPHFSWCICLLHSFSKCCYLISIRSSLFQVKMQPVAWKNLVWYIVMHAHPGIFDHFFEVFLFFILIVEFLLISSQN